VSTRVCGDVFQLSRSATVDRGLRFTNIAISNSWNIGPRPTISPYACATRLRPRLAFSALTSSNPDGMTSAVLMMRFMQQPVCTAFPAPAACRQCTGRPQPNNNDPFMCNTLADTWSLTRPSLSKISVLRAVRQHRLEQRRDDFRVPRRLLLRQDAGLCEFNANLYQGATVHSVGNSGNDISEPIRCSQRGRRVNYRSERRRWHHSGRLRSALPLSTWRNRRVVGSTVDRCAYEAAWTHHSLRADRDQPRDIGAAPLRQRSWMRMRIPDLTSSPSIARASCPQSSRRPRRTCRRSPRRAD